MIKRIELTNFMSHEQTVLEPAPGLTLLIGPNNCGKSAVVAALQILTNNADSNYAVRHGAKECAIAVETDDGHCIEWRRKKSPSYTIDGEKFDRLGKGGVPDELGKALRMKQVDVGEAMVDIHFGEQKSPLFLIDKKASHAARFFAASSDVSRLVAMQNRHRDKHNEAKKGKTRLEAESAQLAKELDALAPMVALDAELDEQEAAYRQLEALGARILALAEIERQILSVSKAIFGHTETCEALSPLAPPPALEPAAPLQLLIGQLTGTRQGLERETIRTEQLQSLAPPPELADTSGLDERIRKLDAADRQLAECARRRQATADLAVPPSLADTTALARSIDRIEAATRDARRADAWREGLAALAIVPEIVDERPLAKQIALLEQSERMVAAWQHQQVALTALTALPALADSALLAASVRQFESLAAEIARQESELADAAKQRAAVETELRQWAREQQTCPTCGATLDGDRLTASCAGGTGEKHG